MRPTSDLLRLRARPYGQTTLLIVGFAIVAIMMVGVVVDASAAYLRRAGLDSLADGASRPDRGEGGRVFRGGQRLS